MPRLLSACLAAALAVTTVVAVSPAASASSVTSRGNTVGTKYRGGIPSLGGISYAAGLQLTTDGDGSVKVRGAGRITKVSKVSRVQVDSVALGTSTTGITKNSVARSSGTGNAVINYTSWKVVPVGTCTRYRVRVGFSVRWSDGALSKFSVLSPLTLVCGKNAVKSCPAPREIPRPGTNLLTVTKCYDSNNWILATGLYPSGDPIDGISVIHQTSPGKFVYVTEGSDFTGSAAGLRRLGIPANLVSLLTHSSWSFSGGKVNYPRSAYTGTWERHTSSLQIGATRGSIFLGSGCCNGIGFPLTYALDPVGVLRGTVNGPATYVGTEFNDIRLTVGTNFYFHFEPGATGLVLVSTNRTFPAGGALVWCGQHYDGRCGA